MGNGITPALCILGNGQIVTFHLIYRCGEGQLILSAFLRLIVYFLPKFSHHLEVTTIFHKKIYNGGQSDPKVSDSIANQDDF